MIEIHIDDSSEIIAHAVDVFRATGSWVDAITAVKPVYAENLEVAILQALAAELGGQSQ